MKKILAIVVIAILIQYSLKESPLTGPAVPSNDPPQFSTVVSDSDSELSQAFEQQRSDLQIQGEGVVQKILADDTVGSRHQRFILRLNSGQTLLVAHNIDLAPRVSSLRTGDPVQFFGEYEWNPEGGVIHWTHHDPQGDHIDGWLRHAGTIYK